MLTAILAAVALAAAFLVVLRVVRFAAELRAVARGDRPTGVADGLPPEFMAALADLGAGPQTTR